MHTYIIHKHTYIHVCVRARVCKDTHIHKWIDGQTVRQTDRQTDKMDG